MRFRLKRSQVTCLTMLGLRHGPAPHCLLIVWVLLQDSLSCQNYVQTLSRRYVPPLSGSSIFQQESSLLPLGLYLCSRQEGCTLECLVDDQPSFTVECVESGSNFSFTPSFIFYFLTQQRSCKNQWDAKIILNDCDVLVRGSMSIPSTARQSLTSMPSFCGCHLCPNPWVRFFGRLLISASALLKLAIFSQG